MDNLYIKLSKYKPAINTIHLLRYHLSAETINSFHMKDGEKEERKSFAEITLSPIFRMDSLGGWQMLGLSVTIRFC